MRSWIASVLFVSLVAGCTMDTEPATRTAPPDVPQDVVEVGVAHRQKLFGDHGASHLPQHRPNQLVRRDRTEVVRPQKVEPTNALIDTPSNGREHLLIQRAAGVEDIG